ncbi:hypothetical protein ABPG74_013184 [Tetrahymena malaccensis]
MIYLNGYKQSKNFEEFIASKFTGEKLIVRDLISKRENPQMVSDLIQAFSNCSNLQTLIFENFYKFDDVEFLTNLISSLKECAKLQNLSFQLGNISMNKYIESFSQALVDLPNLLDLKLDLSLCKIDEQNTLILGQKLAKCHNLQILDINLDNNFNDNTKNGSNFSYNLVTGISKCMKLSELTLTLSSNKIDGNCQTNICSALQNCSSLKKLILNLESNYIESSNALNIISQNVYVSQPSNSFILPSFKNLSILHLNFNNNNLDHHNASQFGEALSSCQNLQNFQFKIWYNNFFKLIQRKIQIQKFY